MIKYNPLEDRFVTFEAVNVDPVQPMEMDLFGPVDIGKYGFSGVNKENGNLIVANPLEEKEESKVIFDNPVHTTDIYYDDNTKHSTNPSQKYNNYSMSTSVKGNKKQAMDFFYTKLLKLNEGKEHAEELSLMQAAGIVGNLMFESGDPTLSVTNKTGDKGTSYGLAQWRKERRTLLNNFAKGKRKPISDFNTQLEFVWKELNSSHKSALNGLLNSNNVSDATTIFMNNFEIPNADPKINGINKRIKYAESLLS